MIAEVFNKMSIKLKIIAKIESNPKGWVFSRADFLDPGSCAAINQVLSRLSRTGLIRRIGKGLYDVPVFNSLLNAYSPPSCDQIVQAISRRDGIKIISDNIVQANRLGLTNAVPARIIYLTDGASRIVRAGGWTIQLKRVKASFMADATGAYGQMFQALTWLGKDIV